MLRCLIVDDSAHFLDVARVLLERDGVAVVGVATNRAQALQAVAQLRPEVVLVDIDLGGESGFALAEQLPRHSDGALRIILISAQAEEDYADLIAASPAIGFLPKTSLSGQAIRDQLEAVSGPRGT